MMKKHERNPAFLTAMAIAVAIAAPHAAAQRGWYQNAGHSSKVRVPDDLGREPLEVAKTALSGGDVDRALSVYQDILDRLPDRVAASYLAPRSGSETDHVIPNDRFVGLRDCVADLIRGIPDGLARYRSREGPRAAADLARAIASRDEQELRKIVIRWELTESGPLALAALADILFQTGRIEEARICSDRLLALVSLDGQPPGLRARAALRDAVAQAVLGRRDGLRALATLPSGGDAALTVSWRGATIPLGEVLTQLMADVEKTPAPPRTERTLASFARPTWQSHPFSRHDSDADEIFRSWDSYVSAPLSSYFPVIPAVSDSAVYFCDGLRVEGMSLIDGHPLWPPVEAPIFPLDFKGYRNWNLMHEVALDRGTVYACLEDEPDIKGQTQHMIAGFKPIETIAVRKLYAIDANTGEIRWSHANLDGVRDPEERAFLARISVNTPPLVLGERLYVGATFYFGGFRQWLCAFDRETGGLVWKTYIGQGQAELNMFGNPVKEVVPGYVGEHEGVIVYSTNIGVVAAVDAVTGTPRWVSAYEQELVPSTDGQRTNSRPPSWTVTRPLFHAGRAIIAPSDSKHVYVFNLETGEGRPIPGASRNPGRDTRELRHVVGIFDDALVIAGRKVYAFDLKGLGEGQAPRPKWEAPPDGALTANASIDGRPAVAGDRLFYTGCGSMAPGARARAPSYIASIDVRTGRIIEERQVEGALFRGNIVFSSDAVVVAGYELTAIFDAREVAKRLEAAIAKNPDDADLQLRAGQIELQNRNLERAISAFERARGLAAGGGSRGEMVYASATRALYNLMLDLAAEPVTAPGLPSTPKERFEKALAYAATPRQQVVALVSELLWARKAGKPGVVREIAGRILNELSDERLRVEAETAEAMPELARGSEMRAGLLAALVAGGTLADGGQHQDAVAFYQQALARFADDAVPGPSATMSVWRYAFAKIAEIIKTRGAGSYAAEERAAQALLDEARATGNLDALRTLLDRYPNSRNVEPAWIELSRRLREAGKDRDALRAVQRQLARYGAVTAALLSELARSLEGAGAFESARDVLLTLKERFGSDQIAAESGPVDVASYVEARLASEALRPFMAPPPMPTGTIGLQPGWAETPATQGDEVALVVPEGRRPPQAEALALIHRDGELRAIEIETGKVKWARAARSLGDSARPVWHDGRLLAVMDGDLAALEPATGREHWRANAPQMRTLAIHAAHGKAYVMLRSTLGGRNVIVRALDLVTGEKLRDLEFALPSSPSDAASFASSPLWLLCRLDAATGSLVVLDGITGETVLLQTTGLTSMPSALTANNLLVTQSASGTSGVREVTIVARNPRTQQTVWNFKLERVTSTLGTIAMTPQLAVFSVRFGDGMRVPARRDLIVLDLVNGTTRMSIGLRPQDITQDGGAVSGDVLLVKIATPDGKQFIRAYDTRKSALLWDSVTYSGVGLYLWVLPTQNYAVVRVSSRDVATDKRTDTIHFFDNRTGLLKDSITLENTLTRPNQPGTDVRDRALILRSGTTVSVRK